MQCSCGGSTVPKELPKVKAGKVISKLEFSECSSCGRVGPKTLTSYSPTTGKIISSVRL